MYKILLLKRSHLYTRTIVATVQFYNIGNLQLLKMNYFLSAMTTEIFHYGYPYFALAFLHNKHTVNMC